MKNPKSLILAFVVFIGCLLIGFWVARHKAIWNDEYYTQVSSVNNISYIDQILGHIPEGGNAPLFYSIQKAFLQLIHFQTPPMWLQGHWFNDTTAQWVLRINPVVFMSLSMGIVFYYFCKRYSIAIGLYSLFIYLSSYMLWAYWAEARPYALVIFLTTVQSVILLKKMDQGTATKEDRSWACLAAVNILLSLTSILSLGEIWAVSLLWWQLKECDWRKYLALTALPTMTVLYYYGHAPKYPYYFGDLSPEQLIRDNISRERFDILIFFVMSLSVYWGSQRITAFKDVISPEIIKPLPYFIFMLVVLGSSVAELWLFSLHAKPSKGFPVASRYFIYLTPIGVIATTILSVSLIKSLNKNSWIQWGLVVLIGLLLAQHFLKVVPHAIHSISRGQ